MSAQMLRSSPAVGGSMNMIPQAGSFSASHRVVPQHQAPAYKTSSFGMNRPHLGSASGVSYPMGYTASSPALSRGATALPQRGPVPYAAQPATYQGATLYSGAAVGGSSGAYVTSMTGAYESHYVPVGTRPVQGGTYTFNIPALYDHRKVPMFEAPLEIKVPNKMYSSWWNDMIESYQVTTGGHK